MVMVHGVCRAKSTAVGFYKLVPDDVDLKEVWREVGVDAYEDQRKRDAGARYMERSFKMKIGVIISSNDAETSWNALRYANFCLGQKDEVKVFLTGKGVEYQNISTEKFNTIEQADKLLKSGGKIFACGTCIKSRNQEGTEMCPINTMKDMYEIVKESDKVVAF